MTFGISGKNIGINDNKCEVILIDSKKFIEYVNNKKICIPEFQRELDENKIEKIKEEFIERHKKNENYFIKHGYTISLCKIGILNELYVIDGQHRMEVIFKILEKGFNPQITVRIQLCENEKEMEKDFEQLNSNSDIPPIYKFFKNKFVKNMLLQIKNKIKEDYKSAFNQNKNSTVSNRMHLDNFISLFDLDRIDKSLLNITYEQLYNKLLQINNDIIDDMKNMEEQFYIKKSDKKIIEKTNFYLSLKNIDWIEKIYDNDYKINYNNINYYKKKIPKTLQKYVLNRDLGKDNHVGNCYVCNIEINRYDAQMGHVIAEHLGGKTHEDNLKTICKSCNCSMGIQNMDEFKKKFFNCNN